MALDFGNSFGAQPPMDATPLEAVLVNPVLGSFGS